MGYKSRAKREYERSFFGKSNDPAEWLEVRTPDTFPSWGLASKLQHAMAIHLQRKLEGRKGRCSEGWRVIREGARWLPRRQWQCIELPRHGRREAGRGTVVHVMCVGAHEVSGIL